MKRVAVVCAVLASSLAFSTSADRRGGPRSGVSPVRGIERDQAWGRVRPSGHPNSPAPGYRSYDGSSNNKSHELWGAAFTQLIRLFPSDYDDGMSMMAGAIDNRPSPRWVSNAVADQPAPISIENPLGTSDALWQWGQFLDHDLDLSDGTDPAEPEPIPIPAGDPTFDPNATGTATMDFNRSIYDPETGESPDFPREQINEISSYLDASQVYGSDAVRAKALRTLDGSGRMKTSPGNLLPFNTGGFPNAGGTGADLFLAGDPRANEQVALTAMHTLFVREHNRLVRRLARRHRTWDGERLYQEARKLVGAELQVITYREFLPALLGPDALPPYRGYDPEVNAGISNAFSAAAFRFGHSALSSKLLRLNRKGREIAAGHLALRDAFFSPHLIQEEGIASLLRGLAAQPHQRIDPLVVDDVRNFLFGHGSDGLDLAALNIQRGRDHGLPPYNATRVAMGLPPALDFSDISNDPAMQTRLATAYAHPDDVDLWVGCLAEPPLPRSHLGALAQAIVVEQFVALRNGDWHWYANVMSPAEVRRIERTRLSDVIRRNTSIGRELPRDVFRVHRRRR